MIDIDSLPVVEAAVLPVKLQWRLIHYWRDTGRFDAAHALIDRGNVRVVLVSLGRGGALLVTAEGTHCLGAPPVPLRSKVGAGDSMVGGVVTALAKGWSVLDAARFGVAAGAAAVMTAGTELCRREDTERLYAEVRRAT